ncbi:MAG: hypothetical protein CMO41_01230 [Verrucomicrobiales bacterium]|nr:hypothetical protein [Verrucomicrobiales bacterium]
MSKTWLERAVDYYGRIEGDRWDTDIVLPIAFLPAGFGILMIMSGDAGSMFFGALCCLWGLVVFSLFLRNEHRVYLEEKKAKNDLKAKNKQMEYLERLGATDEEDR